MNMNEIRKLANIPLVETETAGNDDIDDMAVTKIGKEYPNKSIEPLEEGKKLAWDDISRPVQFVINYIGKQLRSQPSKYAMDAGDITFFVKLDTLYHTDLKMLGDMDGVVFVEINKGGFNIKIDVDLVENMVR